MRLVLLFLILLLPLPASAQPAVPDAALQARLDAVVEGFQGDVGVYVRHLPTGRFAAIHADTLFPTASMIKVPILIKTFDLIEHDSLGYHDEVVVESDSIKYPYSPYEFSAKMTAAEPIELSKLVMLMITLSENNASLWLQERVGGTAVNDWLEEHGFTQTRVNSRTPGREADREHYGWGQTTPREMAELLVLIRRGEAVSPAASEEMYRVLTRIYYNSEALSQLPPWVQAASKQGAVNQSRSEVVLVNAPHGDYVFCVITKNQEDTSWTHENAGFQLLRDLSRSVWQYFEPDAAWQPAEGTRKYR